MKLGLSGDLKLGRGMKEQEASIGEVTKQDRKPAMAGIKMEA